MPMTHANAQLSPLIVTGMHRSGTSLAASIVSALSIDMGQDLLTADSNNIRGYFEDVEFLELQRAMLSESCAEDDGGHPDWGWTESDSLDLSCLKKFLTQASGLIGRRASQPKPWGWKDPRTTLLLDFWDDLLPDARYLFVYRFPWDVADSMQRLGAEVFLRNPEYGYRIWEFYNRRIRDFCARHSDRCLLISTNALRGSLSELPALITSKLGINASVADLQNIQQRDLLKATSDADPLIDLVKAIWPNCIGLLSELDALADISAKGLWQARPVRSRLGRPDRPTEGECIDISVVTPCYNQGVLLVEAIASVERFAPPNCELIIVNDGSDDPRTLEILEVLKGCGYFILDQENLGLSGARNTGIAKAQGHYILPLDDDNRVRANFIHDAIKVLDASPEVGVVYGDRYDFGLTSGIRQIPEFDLTWTLKVNYVDACAVFRRQIWHDCGGYDADMSPMEDWELWIQAAELGWLFHHLPYVTFDYRVRPGSLLSFYQAGDAPQEFRKKILRKHPGLSAHVSDLVQLLSSKLAIAEQNARTLSVNVEEARNQIIEKGEAINALRRELGEVEQERSSLVRQLTDHKDLRCRIEEISEQLARSVKELTTIKGTRGWRLLSRYGKIKHAFLRWFSLR